MRLTLRTLLAWLDDTLPPAEVREIGKQVTESPLAQDLKEKIHLVTRQRRLTVPLSSGPNATDPNLVASYLDNELAPESVADFEKLCLTSDVNLAEVASVHQILSLVGQKAKVPTEARHRMYNLIKGRESLAAKPRRTPKRSEQEPSTEPVQPWVAAPAQSRSGWDRYLLPTGVVALLLLLTWSAWMSLRSSGSRADRRGPYVVGTTKDLAKTGPVPPADASRAAMPSSEPPKRVDTPKPISKIEAPPSEPDPKAIARAEANPASPVPLDSEKKAQPRVEPPPGAIWHVEKADGAILRWNTERGDWERLKEKAALKDQDRLLSLAPFRASLVLGKAKVDLVGQAEISVFTPTPGLAARVRLEAGRVVLHGVSPDLSYAVQFADRTILVTPPAGSSVGLERSNRREPGSALPSPSLLRIFATEGNVALSVGDDKESLSGPGAIAFEPPAGWTDKSDRSAPSWVYDPGPSAFDKQIGDQFIRSFRDDRPVVANLAEALDDNQKDVRRLAIAALGALGNLSMIVPVLSQPNDPASRRAAIAELRDYLEQGPDAAKSVQEELQSNLGEELAPIIYKLLVGYTAQEAKENSTYASLVKSLSSDDVGVRELALDNLQSLTGRDSLDYDPDAPKGKGLKAWTELLRDRELSPQATRNGR